MLRKLMVRILADSKPGNQAYCVCMRRSQQGTFSGTRKEAGQTLEGSARTTRAEM